MAGQDARSLAGGQVPQQDPGVPAGGGEQPPVRAERHRPNLIAVAGQGALALAGGRVPERPARGRAPAGRPRGAAAPRPSAPQARPHHAPSRCARCSATRAARTTRSGPRPPPMRSSRCERTPPDETTSHGLVHKFPGPDRQTYSSQHYDRADPATVIKVRSASICERRGSVLAV